jgi:hypothetical protein
MNNLKRFRVFSYPTVPIKAYQIFVRLSLKVRAGKHHNRENLREFENNLGYKSWAFEQLTDKNNINRKSRASVSWIPRTNANCKISNVTRMWIVFGVSSVADDHSASGGIHSPDKTVI